MTAVGRSLPKRDAFEKVTGTARYTADLRLPGMLYARFLRSPHPHARITNIDTRAAQALPGIHAILTHANTIKKRYSDGKSDQLGLLPHPHNLDQVLFDDKVRYVGEAVAVAAGVDPRTVQHALELIDVEYELLPAVFDALQALEPNAPRIHDHVQHNTASHLPVSVGDVETAMRDAYVVVEHAVSTSRQKQAQIERTACLAHWDESGRVNVWSPTQTPHLVKQKLAVLFDLPQSCVRVVNPHIGGSFGATMGFTLEPHAVALSRATGRPVLLELSREEMFSNNSSRHPMYISLAMGFARDGHPVAMKVREIANTGAYASEGPDVVAATTAHFLRLYPCPNVMFEGTSVYTNAPPAGGFRGYGGPQAGFAIEQVIDIAAERLQLDPVELRRRICIRKGSVDPLFHLPVRSCGLPECFDRGSERIDWLRRSSMPVANGRWRRGLGMAAVMWVSGTACLPSTLDTSVATVMLLEDGSAMLHCAACDMGTGARTTLVQVAADELGLPFERVQIGPVDTDVTPFEVGAHGSRTLFAAGNAARLAARDVCDQLLAAAAAQLEVAIADLTLENSIISVRGTRDRSLSVAAVVNAAYRRGHQFIGRGESPQVNEPPFGAQFAEVEVDTETGLVRVLRLVAAHDVGRAINPRIVEGQVEGALAQGLGFALLEDMPLDAESGSPQTLTFADYRIPTVSWMPPLEVILVEDPSPSGPFGAKGAGEMGLGPTAAAIANAIHNATGVRMSEVPMSPQRVLAALNAARA